VLPFLEHMELPEQDMEAARGKWFFGAAADKHGDVWCAPFSDSALVIVGGRKMMTLQGSGAGGCKWLGVALGGNGKMYCIPYNADNILEIPEAEMRGKRAPPAGVPPTTIYDRTVGFIEGLGNNPCKWTGATAGDDGNVYCVPFNADAVLVIDISNPDYNGQKGESKWRRQAEFHVIPLTGGAPRRSTKTKIKITPQMSTKTVPAWAQAQAKWAGAVLGPDGCIYCAPFNAESVLVINPMMQRCSVIEGVPPGTAKWMGAAASADGLIYFAPFNADTVLVVDPATKALSYLGDLGKACGKWAGAVTGSEDGNVYFAPHNADTVLYIKSGKTNGEQQLLHLSMVNIAGAANPPTSPGKWFGCAEGTAGRIICSPMNADTVLVINTKMEQKKRRF
jgi:hypothetical protein